MDSKEISTEDTLVLVLAEVKAIHTILKKVLDADKDALTVRMDVDAVT